MKTTFIIPCVWSMRGEYRIEAESLKEALEIAEDSPLPETDACDFVEGSFEIDHDMISNKKNN